jgi:polar amino acid transport system substrate-binding protein
VNYIDTRLRRGNPSDESDESATMVTSTLGQGMT